MNDIFIGLQLREHFMAEENKKGGFWASLFGRNKKQDEPKIEPIIEEEKIKDIESSIEKFETHDLVEEEKIQEISTALKPVVLEPVEEIIEAKNLEDDLQPVVEIETREKPSEGGFFSRLVKGLLKTKQNIGAGFRSFFLGKKIDDELFEE